MTARKVVVTLPEELYELVERARAIEHRSRSEIVQEALRTHFGEATYVPGEDERRQLVEALDEAEVHPESLLDRSDVHDRLQSMR